MDQQDRIDTAVDRMLFDDKLYENLGCSCCIETLADDLCDTIEYPDLPELAYQLRLLCAEDAANETETILVEPLLEIAAKVFEWFWRVQEDDCFCNEFAQENLLNAAAALLILGRFDILQNLYSEGRTVSVGWRIMMYPEV